MPVKLHTCGAGLLIAAALSSGIVAAEPTWVDIPIKITGMRTAYDSSSLVIDGTRRTVWMEIRYAHPTRMKRGMVSRIVSLTIYDCFRRTSQSTQALIYAPNGDSSEESDQYERAERVRPGTVAESQLDAVCVVPARN